MKIIATIKRALNSLAHNQEWLYILFCPVLMMTCCALAVTERMSCCARIAFLLVPLATQMLLLAATKKPGLFFLILIPKIIIDAFQLVLLKLYGNSIIATDMFLNLVTTSATEAGELLGSIASVILFMLIVYVPSICFAVVSVRNKRGLRPLFRKRALLSGAALLVVGILFIFAAKGERRGFNIKYDLYPANVIYNLNCAVKKWGKIENYPVTSKDFTFQARRSVAPAEGGREIYMLVIGETARADNWGMYGYRRNTTPMLDTLPGLLKFQDVLSQSNTTHKSVPMLLTPASAENYTLTYSSKSLVTLFKEAGFKTLYLTNHEYHHTLMANYFKEADIAISIKDSAGNSHDSQMIEPLRRILDSTASNLFIVVHLYGSHFKYEERYDKEEAHFRPDVVESISIRYKQELINSYDNSILSTDRVLYNLIESIRRQNCISLCLYTSDHGEDLFDDRRGRFLHASPIPTFYQIHVPFVAWCSPAYKEHNGEKWQNMVDNRALPLSTSSAIFHTLADLASIETKYLDSKLSLCSKEFEAVPRRYLTDHEESVRIDELPLTKYDYEEFEEKNIKLH